MILHEKKSGFLNKALRPRSLRSLASPTAEGRWRRVGLLGEAYAENLAKIASELSVLQPI